VIEQERDETAAKHKSTYFRPAVPLRQRLRQFWLHPLLQPLGHFVIIRARRYEIPELVLAHARFMKELLVHWTSKPKISLVPEQGRSAFIERSLSHRHAGEFFVRAARFLRAQIARVMPHLFQIGAHSLPWVEDSRSSAPRSAGGSVPLSRSFRVRLRRERAARRWLSAWRSFA